MYRMRGMTSSVKSSVIRTHQVRFYVYALLIFGSRINYAAGKYCAVHVIPNNERRKSITSPGYDGNYAEDQCTQWKFPQRSDMGETALLIFLEEMEVTYEYYKYTWCTGNIYLSGQNICGLKAGSCLLFCVNISACIQPGDPNIEVCQSIYWTYGESNFPSKLLFEAKNYKDGNEVRKFVIQYSYINYSARTTTADSPTILPSYSSTAASNINTIATNSAEPTTLPSTTAADHEASTTSAESTTSPITPADETATANTEPTTSTLAPTADHALQESKRTLITAVTLLAVIAGIEAFIIAGLLFLRFRDRRQKMSRSPEVMENDNIAVVQPNIIYSSVSRENSTKIGNSEREEVVNELYTMS